MRPGRCSTRMARNLRPAAELVALARDRLREVPGLGLDGPGVEPTKLVVLIAGTGAQGYAIEADLVAAGMPVEIADRDTVVPTVTLADEDGTSARSSKLIAAIERHRARARAGRRGVDRRARNSHVPPRRVLRRTRPSRRSAVGRVSAELIAPYPPGIPVLAPGELITAPRWTRSARSRRRRPHRLRGGPVPRHLAGHQHLARGDGLSRRVPPGAGRGTRAR